ncbi:MAG TPA: S8 family serine peptidase [Pyrinomonadaceae bacterium]|nr:S8 family serine peptidase [Pyrinomonadaceae bacterium]
MHRTRSNKATQNKALKNSRSRRRVLVTLMLLLCGAIAISSTAWLSNRNASAAPQDPGISPEALAQIEALIEEKESRSETERKMDSQLIYEAKMDRGEVIADGIRRLDTDVQYSYDGRTIVDITANVTDNLLAQLSQNGAEILETVADRNSVRAAVPVENLEAIAALPDVKFMQPRQDAMTSGITRGSAATAYDVAPGESTKTQFANRANKVRGLLNAALQDRISNVSGNIPPTGQGSQTSEGDATHRAFAARGTFHADGTGIKIGVLSDGVTSLAASQALGDLGPVTVLPGQAGSGDEGTAMLEIVHDIAPGAQLFFATAFTSITSFAQNVRALRTAGCDIIIDDVFYFVETPFQDGQLNPTNTNGGVVIQAVNDVTADGAMYFSSAGNSGNLTDGTSGVWEGDFVDGGGTASPLALGNRLHNFGGQNFNTLTVANTASPISLYWSDPLGGSSNDYDLFRLNAAGTAVAASSTNIQNGTQDPYEQISQSTANPRIVIVKKAAAAPRFLHLNTNRGRLSIATSGTTHGHSAVANAFSVAATPANLPNGAPPNPTGPFPNPFGPTNATELFSSDGPRRIFFQANGTLHVPGGGNLSTGGIVRQKPDITAADGTSITGVGSFPSPFYGTSAAAPHAGAIAALLKSANPSFTNAQIRTAMISSAIDIEVAGVDRDSGAGIVMAYNAFQALGVEGTADIEFGTINANEDPGDGNGTIDAGEGARVDIQLRNLGVADATGITATLTTSTPGINIQTPTASAYPDLAAGGGNSLNLSPFRFTVASNVPCPLLVHFTLTVNYAGGPSPKVLTFTVQTGRTMSISSTLDGTAPAVPPGFTSAITGTQVGRINRFVPASSCGVDKANPGLFTNAGVRQFDAYTFTACSDSCVTISNDTGAGNINLFPVVYKGAFNPANLTANYYADPGSSSSGTPFSFNVTAGQTYTIVVHEVSPGGGLGNNYTLNILGCIVNCEPPNQAPVAKAKNVTFAAGPDCTANASIDDGSFDPDGDPVVITQSPAGPYALGITTVLLTVTDPNGATSQATATVTVEDSTGPDITGATASPDSLWPPNHQMVPITISYSTSDNCNGANCSLHVSSNEPVNGQGDADTGPDWIIVDDHHVMLRAERSAKGTGRVYTITIDCVDGVGNHTIRTVTVRVPRSQGG